MSIFCWHDWEPFQTPSKNILVRKVGKRYLYAYFHNGEAIGKALNENDVSDLICYKCGKKKLNLTNKLKAKQVKIDKEKAKIKKQKERDIALENKRAEIAKLKREAVLAAQKEMQDERDN